MSQKIKKFFKSLFRRFYGWPTIGPEMKLLTNNNTAVGVFAKVTLVEEDGSTSSNFLYFKGIPKFGAKDSDTYVISNRNAGFSFLVISPRPLNSYGEWYTIVDKDTECCGIRITYSE